MDPHPWRSEGTPPPRPERGDDGEAVPAEPLATRTSQTHAATTAAPAPAPAPLRPFGDVSLRPDGQRYGDADLYPAGVGGGGSAGGGMLMGDAYFRSGAADAAYAQNPANAFARYDPIMPGQQGPAGGGGGVGIGRAPQRAPPFPGEPDPDHLMPLQGGPRDPFGGPGGGQFGPGRGRGFGGGGFNGGFSSW